MQRNPFSIVWHFALAFLFFTIAVVTWPFSLIASAVGWLLVASARRRREKRRVATSWSYAASNTWRPSATRRARHGRWA